jgi:hypothetical protein
MAPIVAVAFLTIALPATFVRATQMRTWSGQNCNSGNQVTFTGHSADCVQLSTFLLQNAFSPAFVLIFLAR